MSSGAYFTEIRRCRRKIKKTIYALLVLRLVDAVDGRIFSVLDELNGRIETALNKDNSDKIEMRDWNSVISLVDNVINKLIVM